MRLGSIIYLVPFIFVLDVTFILEGDWQTIVISIVECLIGIWLVVGALQSFVTGVGEITPIQRVAIGLGGLLIATPDLNLVLSDPPSNTTLFLIGLSLSGVGLAMKLFSRQPVSA